MYPTVHPGDVSLLFWIMIAIADVAYPMHTGRTESGGPRASWRGAGGAQAVRVGTGSMPVVRAVTPLGFTALRH